MPQNLPVFRCFWHCGDTERYRAIPPNRLTHRLTRWYDGSMATITEFLLARIEEDEADALSAGEGAWFVDGTWWLEGVEHARVGPDEVAFTHPGYVSHIARHDPARVLREVKAKRAIMSEHELEDYEGVPSCWLCAHVFSWGKEPDRPGPCATLRALAAVYADHPDYNLERWTKRDPTR